MTPELEPGQRYLAIATGFLGEGSFQLAPIAEGFEAGTGEAALRVTHASPDAPAVDVGVVDGGFVALEPFSDLAFPESSDAAGVAVPAGTYSFGVAVTGDPDPLFTFSDLGVGEDARLFAIANGSVADGDFGLSIVDATSWPWVTVRVDPD